MPYVVTSTAAYSKVLSSMENAHIMLEMAGKCSNYARNWGLCFSFWIMLFEADYAKNYASILYQCLPTGSHIQIDRFPNYCLGTSNGAWPVAKSRAIASFPYFPYGRVEKRQWEDGQEGEERRLWQSERLVECFLTKGIFEAVAPAEANPSWSGAEAFSRPADPEFALLWHSHQAYWSLSLVLPSQSLCCV